MNQNLMNPEIVMRGMQERERELRSGFGLERQETRNDCAQPAVSKPGLLKQVLLTLLVWK